MDFTNGRTAPLTIENATNTEELAQLVHAVIAAHGIEPNRSWDELAHELCDFEGTKTLWDFLLAAIERWEYMIAIEDEQDRWARREG